MKLFLLIAIVVLAASGLYLGLAVRLFKEDKAQLVYELNGNNVKTLSAQVEATLQKYSDKVRLLAQGHMDERWVSTVFEAEPDLVAFTLFQPSADPAGWRSVVSKRSQEYLRLYGLPPDEIEKIRDRIPVPFARVLSQHAMAWNSTLPGGAPVLSLAVAFEVKGEATPRVAVVDLRLDRILKMISSAGISQVFVVDSEGRIVAHSDAAQVAARSALSDHPLVREAVDSPLAFQVRAFEWRDEKWIGAYSTVKDGGLRVISQVPENQTYRASSRLIQKSILFGAIVVTTALLLAGWLAGTFTDPIRRLLAATEKLSRWEFGETIQVGTRDEIAGLAKAFNTMASDIQRQHLELQGQAEKLEIKVRERTEALETEKKRLAEAQEALVRTTRLASLGELAGAAAHEILNPLNNMNIRLERCRGKGAQAEAENLALAKEILAAWRKAYEKGGWKELETELSRPADDGSPLLLEDLGNLESVVQEVMSRQAEGREDLEFLSKEITRVTRMVNNMRQLSRVGGDRKRLDIHVPLDDTATALGDLLEKRKITLQKKYAQAAGESLEIIGDRDELIQVFSNLIRNALQAVSAAKRRAGIITVETRRNDDRIEVRIIDNGTGIDPMHLDRLFEPNFTTKSMEEGTGLGLSISRRFVRAFGGDIELERTGVGEGTVFLVWFPSADQAKAEVQA